MEFEGKRVLITGASRGIGRALAARFIREGARVAVNGRDAARLETTATQLGAAAAVAGDLSTAAACETVVKETLAALGGLDVLINNAGIFPIAAMAETDEAMWDETFGANLKSTFFTSRAALDALRAAHGVILNHGSIAGLIGLANISAYCASKGAVVHLTRAMAMELAPEIRVNCVCPTTVDNDLGWKSFKRSADPQAAHDVFVAASKLKRMPTNDDVVEAFVYLASPRAGFLTGVALPVDGGKSAGV
jgi:NAD(P)-dependent dehydrogenase (short-subunit alcohol dehydrogenase family)